MRVEATRTPPGRFKNLDGLRGVAALVVLLHHALLPIPEVANPLYGNPDAGGWTWFVYSPLHVVVAGTEAVLVFFVLSGFVLTLPVLRARNFSWRAYYPSRIVRLYLPVIASVLWSLLVIVLLPRSDLRNDPSAWMSAHAEPITVWTPFVDAFLLAGTSNLNGPLWSLRWEVLFSLLLPLYVWVGVLLSRLWVAVTAAVAVLSVVVTVAGMPAMVYLLTFLIGVVFATGLENVNRLCSQVNRSRLHRVWWALLAALGVLTLTARWTLSPHLPPSWAGSSTMLVVLGAAIWLFVAFGSAAAGRFLTIPVIGWLGTISFSLYLTHEPIVVAVAQLLPASVDRFNLVLSAPLSLLVAWAFSKAVENPTHRLSQKIRTTFQPHAREVGAGPGSGGVGRHRRA